MIGPGRRRGVTVRSGLLLLAAAYAPLHAGNIDGKRTGHSGSPRSSAPIVIRGQSDVVIRNVRITNPDGPCILVEDSVDVTVKNVHLGPCRSEAIRAKRVDGLRVSRSTMENAYRGVFALNSRRIRVVRNDFLGLHRSFVQFDKVDGPDNLISRNFGDTGVGNARTEDLVNLYRSNGVRGGPIRVIRNHFRGGGRSRSGSGIMLGDSGGSHQLAQDNVLVEPGQVGIGVASGTDIRVTQNRIYQPKRPWANVALYVWNQSPTPCDDIRVVRNRVSWRKADGQRVGWWSGGGCGFVREVSNDFDAGLTEAIFGK